MNKEIEKIKAEAQKRWDNGGKEKYEAMQKCGQNENLEKTETTEKITEAKQHFINEIFDKAKYIISKMSKNTYAIVLYTYFFENVDFCQAALYYNTESHFRKYFNKNLKNTEQFTSWQKEYSMTWEEYVKGTKALKWCFCALGWNDKDLDWRCKAIGGYNISEKYMREIICEVENRLLAKNIIVENFGKDIPFVVTDVIEGILELDKIKKYRIARRA